MKKEHTTYLRNMANAVRKSPRSIYEYSNMANRVVCPESLGARFEY